MIVNLIPKTTTFAIATTDVSSMLIHASGQYSQISESGLIIITAKFELAQTIGSTFVLDDRFNPIQRGTKLTLMYNGSLCPVLGTTFVDSTSYDIKERILTINATCLLGLCNALTTSDLGLCVGINSTTNYDLACSQLLQKARIQPASISLAFGAGQLQLQQHIFLSDSDSFVKLAGTLAYSMDRCLYQGNDGIIRSFQVKQAASALILNTSINEMYTYDRLPEQQQPPDTIRVRGQTIKKEPYKTGVIETSALGYPTLKITRTGRTIQTITSSYGSPASIAPTFYGEGAAGTAFGNIVAQRTITVETYESEPTIANSVFDAELGQCVPVDTGRLVSRVTYEYAPNAAAFEAYWQNSIEAGINPTDFVPPLQLALIKQTNEDWSYNLKDSEVAQFSTTTVAALTPDTSAQDEESATYTKTVREAIGSQAPALGDPTLGTSTELILSPATLAFAEFQTISWAKKGGKWSGTTTTQLSKIKANPQLIQSVIAQGELDSPQIYSAMFARQTIANETKADWQPQSPGVIPPDFTYTNSDYVVACTFGGGSLFPRLQEISIGDTSNPSFAAQLGLSSGFIAWSRQKSCIASLPLASIPAGYVPLNHCYVQENGNIKVEYAIDGLSIVIEPNQAIASFTGLYIGSYDSIVAPPAIQAPTDPPYTTSINTQAPILISPNLDISSVDLMEAVIIEPLSPTEITEIRFDSFDEELFIGDIGYNVYGNIYLTWMLGDGLMWIVNT